MDTINEDLLCSEPIAQVEYGDPNFVTILRIIYCSIRSFFVERPGIIIGSSFLLLMLWGTHGKIELLRFIWPNWRGPGIDLDDRPQLIPGIPWDNELISFWVGAFLVVVIPCLIIKFHFRQSLSEYGLGLPPKGKRKLAITAFIFLMVTSALAFFFASLDPSMRVTYPFFRDFSSIGQFLIYELTYLPFFIAIEFIFRGYLLFGLAGIRDVEVSTVIRSQATTAHPEGEVIRRDIGIPGVYYFARYALLIQMLSYTAWHLGKPVPELWRTVVWGLAAGAIAYSIRSIWPIILAHWLLNVGLDYLILHFTGVF